MRQVAIMEGQIRANQLRLDKMGYEHQKLTEKRELIDYEILNLENSIERVKAEIGNLSYEINSK